MLRIDETEQQGTNEVKESELMRWIDNDRNVSVFTITNSYVAEPKIHLENERNKKIVDFYLLFECWMHEHVTLSVSINFYETKM